MKHLQWLALSSAATALASSSHDNTSCSTRPYSTWMADSIISRGQGIATIESTSSIYLQVGVVQAALLQLLESPLSSSHRCAQHDYRSYVRQGTKSIVGKLLNASEDTHFPLDRLSLGRGLLDEYLDNSTSSNDRQTAKSAIDTLKQSIDLQPKNQWGNTGGLWYFTYPNWSYLDGMYSYTGFKSMYTNNFNSSAVLNTTNDIIYQLDLLWIHCFDNNTDLLFHGYDASVTASWAAPITGASPLVWGRSMGWYFMALIDWLDENSSIAPSNLWHHVLVRYLDFADALLKMADPNSGAWWQVLNYPSREGNYIESSGSAMFTYGLYKGARLGLFDDGADKYKKAADKAYDYLVDNFVVENQNGTLSWNGTVSVCSLNSSATYDYYVNQPILYDSVHGSASFVLASLENELSA
ncbi:hypothetical protein PISL3812_08320 [Talaromyces islandicus]|uniref:Unsaturated rhamnogalacturonyl hydrolase YteR n=1 Tax=Talaromyces islandicus TaxID=28573 RepID=A0A0U1M7D3_TALIS|nr:hypothetical protein PISL3812_08320 [Talaromyces islandicus]